MASYVFLTVPPFIMASIPWFIALDMERYFDNDPNPEHQSKFYYRIQCGTLVYGGISSAVLSLVPSLVKSVEAWKSVAPEMSLWGHLFFALPILDVMLTYPTVCVGLQASALLLCRQGHTHSARNGCAQCACRLRADYVPMVLGERRSSPTPTSPPTRCGARSRWWGSSSSRAR